MTTPINERLTAPPFHPHANERADYETRGTTLVEYLARRAAKTVILAPLRELLAVARPGGPLPAAALLYFAYYAVAASTSYGRGYQKPTPSTERSAVERDREQPALITARSIGAPPFARRSVACRPIRAVTPSLSGYAGEWAAPCGCGRQA